jgi:hypothetical protein
MVTSSHIQITKLYVNDDDMQDQEPLTLYAVSPRWAKRLEDSKLFPPLPLDATIVS